MTELLLIGAESHQLQDHSLRGEAGGGGGWREKKSHIFGTDPEELV